MHHTVYKITNTLNDRFYVGIHRTENLDDGYMGSGKLIKQARQKYGGSVFVKEILFDFDTYEEMVAKEAEIVTLEFVQREDTYNLVPGGYQGDAFYRSREKFTSEDMSRWGRKGNARKKELAAIDPTYQDRMKVAVGATMKRLHTEGRIRYDTFTGRKHTPASIEAMRISSREPSLGERNSQWGTAWICKPGERPRKIKKETLPEWFEKGWRRGRKS